MDFLGGVKDLAATAAFLMAGISNLFVPGSNKVTSSTNIDTTPSVLFQSSNSFLVSGAYQYLGQTISYQVNVPKKGGPLNGTVDGTCTGKVQGLYEGSPSGNISGKLTADCKVGFISQQIKANFGGKVNEGEKKAHLNWSGDGFLAGKNGNLILDLDSN